MLEVLPTDEHSRSEWLVGIAFFIRAMREPAMAAVLAEGAPKVIAFFTDQLTAAQRDGLLAEDADPYQESVLMWSLVDSQSTAIVLGERTPAEAVVTVDYYLDRLFASGT